MPTRLAAALAALLLVVVAACNGADDPVAATVDGTEIHVDAVERRVEAAKQDAEVRAALEEDPEAVEEELAARVLSGLIVRQVLVDGAADIGVRATEDDIAEARTQLEEAVGGADALAEQMDATGVPEEQVDEELESLALLHLVGEHLTEEATAGQELDADAWERQVQQRARTWLAERLAAAEVVVDAAYGRWDPAAGEVIAPSRTQAGGGTEAPPAGTAVWPRN